MNRDRPVGEWADSTDYLPDIFILALNQSGPACFFAAQKDARILEREVPTREANGQL
jgi:hypothetical protein